MNISPNKVSGKQMIITTGGTPPVASITTSTVSAATASILPDGIQSSVITVQLKLESSDNLTFGGDTVVISSDVGNVTATTDNADGTYTATLTSTVAGSATITASLNALGNIVDTASVSISAVASGLLFANPLTVNGLTLALNRVYVNAVNLHPPTSVAAPTAGPTSVTLSFVPPFIRGNITEYRVYETQQALGLVGTYPYTNQSQVVVSGLTPALPYTFYIVASDGTNLSATSATVGKSTIGANAWNLATGNYISTSVTGMLPEIIYPRPTAETETDAYCNNAYTGMAWEIPVVVQGGSWPFKYELTDSAGDPGTEGVDYPTGMSIGETLTIVGDHQEDGEAYAVLSWPNPTGTSEVIYLKVTDQDGNTATVSTTIAIGTSNFVFVDSAAVSEGVGTIGDPLKTFPTGLWGGSDTDATYAGKIAVFRTGSYDIHDGANGEAVVNATYKPRTYITYPGESPVFNFNTAGLAPKCNDFFIGGINCDDHVATSANWKALRFTGAASVTNRCTVYKCSFTNMDVGTVGNDNPACIYITDTVSLKKQYFSLIRCSTDSTTKIQLITCYAIDYIVSEYNTADGVALERLPGGNGAQWIHMKGSVTNYTVRRNTYVNGVGAPNYVLGSGANADGEDNGEFCWNLVESTTIGGYDGYAMKHGSSVCNGENMHVYRNTLIEKSDYAFNAIARGVGGSNVRMDHNAVHGGISDYNFVAGADISNLAQLEADDFDANGHLQDGGTNLTARTTYLGTHGAEVA